MKTTVTEYKPLTCGKCCGTGRIAQFSHIKAGECFTCGGTGRNGCTTVDRPMTDAEVAQKMAEIGFPIMMEEQEYTSIEDVFTAGAKYAGAIDGARVMLAAI